LQSVLTEACLQACEAPLAAHQSPPARGLELSSAAGGTAAGGATARQSLNVRPGSSAVHDHAGQRCWTLGAAAAGHAQAEPVQQRRLAGRRCAPAASGVGCATRLQRSHTPRTRLAQCCAAGGAASSGSRGGCSSTSRLAGVQRAARRP
jgi:hypothetical protein